MKPFAFLILVSLFLSGCASTAMIPSHQESNVDVDVSIDNATPILVVAKDGSDALITKRYLPDIVSTLQTRGFTEVAAIANSDTAKAADTLQLVVDFSSEVKTYTKKVPIFNHSRNIPYVVCHRNASSGKRTCVTRFHHRMEPIVSGYNLIETETTLYRLDYQLKDQYSKVILDATHSLSNDHCSKWKMFALLAKEAMIKADFSQPIDRSYDITKPTGENCQTP
ncbi:hypothetical protein J9B83_02210 [Marinomonas sp. A79]|uniref:Lipoprotein n=1 Tax=Marinomonas vulgaris TaxID=2823372 RepID=A0ABS5H9T8_9GAMM|nr:hypothetical protein [Marinomonas vulgaris]MBR7887739.1 hypothetical protein [Marinomonas vulgaris]